MTLKEEITAAETNYRGKLERYFARIWGETYLPSHDLSHHRRVWNFAVEILEAIHRRQEVKPDYTPDRLIIACYLHDLGMSSCLGPLHGTKSSSLCREFLLENNLPPDEFSDVISAIKDHDRKEVPRHENQTSLTAMLSASDDLDALGFTGIYRYSEIYLARGIPAGTLGIKVIENARIRFGNLERMLWGLPELTEKHRKRFLILINFFENYNEKKIKNLPEEILSESPGIINVIKKLMSSATDPGEFVAFSKRVTDDRTIHEFFESLYMEMNNSASHSNRPS